MNRSSHPEREPYSLLLHSRAARRAAYVLFSGLGIAGGVVAYDGMQTRAAADEAEAYAEATAESLSLPAASTTTTPPRIVDGYVMPAPVDESQQMEAQTRVYYSDLAASAGSDLEVAGNVQLGAGVALVLTSLAGMTMVRHASRPDDD